MILIGERVKRTWFGHPILGTQLRKVYEALAKADAGGARSRDSVVAAIKK